MIRGTLKTLGAFLALVLFMLVMTFVNLASAYLIAGIALRGDWDRINRAVIQAYDAFLEDMK